MIYVKSEKRSFGINFPSSVEEITPEILKEITKKVNLSNHYCVIALCFKTKLFDFVLSLNHKKNDYVNVIPVMAKISDEDSKEINSEIGNKIIVNRTSLERGNHLSLPISISSQSVNSYFSDKDLNKAIITKDKKLNFDVNENIIILEFKILPVNEIIASIPFGKDPTDPFIVIDNKVN